MTLARGFKSNYLITIISFLELMALMTVCYLV